MKRYNLVRWTRQLRIWLGGGCENQKYLIHHLPLKLLPETIGSLLWPLNYGINILSHTYHHQTFTVRKPIPPGHQIHLRFYENGDVTGHFEVDPNIFPLEHIDRVDLRTLKPEEIEKIVSILNAPIPKVL